MSRVFKVDYIPDPDRGRPLWNAKIFVGVANQDPTIPSNQIQLTGDIGFPVGQSIPVPQPVRTNAGGITVYNNSPLDLNAPGQEYAIQIFDRNDNLIYNFPQVDGSVVMNTTSQEEVTGLTIWPEVGEAVIGQTIPAGTDAIRYPFNGRSTLFTIKPPVAVAGTITNITINSSGIGELEVDNSDVYDLAEFNSFIAANDGDSQLAGGNIWPLSSQEGAQVGDVGLSDVLFLRINSILYTINEGKQSGNITAIDGTLRTATIGGNDVTLSPLPTISIDRATDIQFLSYAIEGQKVQWLGYNNPSDGGSNWGIVKSGSHTADGGSIFTISPTLYVEANITDRFSIKKFGVFGDGSSPDDTDGFTKAMNLGKEIVCGREKSYNVTGLVPTGFTWIDFNFSTVTLIPNSERPIFYDVRAGSNPDILKNFTIKNAKFDGNQDTNNVQNANGGVWLANWENINIENIEIFNCMRIGLNLRGAKDVTIKNYIYRDSGFDGAPTFSYGWILEGTSVVPKANNIVMKNINVNNCRGYGGHLNGTRKAVLKNYTVIGLDYLANSIGLTVTSSDEVEVSNMTLNQCVGDSLEINETRSLTLDNFTISNSGNRGILFGDNFTGIDGSDISISNGQITGSTNQDMAINRVNRLTFENVRMSNGLISVISAEDLTRTSNISFNNCEFNTTMPVSEGQQYRFNYRNCSWLDIKAVNCDLSHRHWGNPIDSANDEGYVFVPQGGTIDLPPLNLLNRDGAPFVGELRITSAFTGAFNDQYSLVTYDIAKTTAALQITIGKAIDGTVSNRRMTVSQGATPNDLILTNNTTVDLRVNWSLETY